MPQAITKALLALRPGAQFSIHGGIVEWLDDAQSEPTAEEIAAELARVVVPQVLTRRQARQALAVAGLFDAVQPAIDAIADPLQRRLAQIDWDDAQQYERGDPFLQSMATALGLSDSALDALFVAALATPATINPNRRTS